MSLVNLEALAHEILKSLNEKQYNVIKKRFAVGLTEPFTLQKIGDEYGITRERVRQIQNEALSKLKRNDTVKTQISHIHEALHQFLLDHGGLKHEEKLLRSFINTYKELTEKEKFIGFIQLLLHLGHPRFKTNEENDQYHAHWFVETEAPKRSAAIVEKIKKHFNQLKTVLPETEVVKEVKKIAPQLSEKAIIAYLEVSKEISPTMFGYWGLSHWEEVKQRGVRGKIYVILEKEKRPLHFKEIARIINQNYPKKVQVPTIHNELIKDTNFVLAGRGTYALRKWGYEDAPVKEVIAKVLKEHKGKMKRDVLIAEVLKRKLVKPETVKINLKMAGVREEGEFVILK